MEQTKFNCLTTYQKLVNDALREIALIRGYIQTEKDPILILAVDLKRNMNGTCFIMYLLSKDDKHYQLVIGCKIDPGGEKNIFLTLKSDSYGITCPNVRPHFRSQVLPVMEEMLEYIRLKEKSSE